jgi:hypothetical protein
MEATIINERIFRLNLRLLRRLFFPKVQLLPYHARIRRFNQVVFTANRVKI